MRKPRHDKKNEARRCFLPNHSTHLTHVLLCVLCQPSPLVRRSAVERHKHEQWHIIQEPHQAYNLETRDDQTIQTIGTIHTIQTIQIGKAGVAQGRKGAIVLPFLLQIFLRCLASEQEAQPHTIIAHAQLISSSFAHRTVVLIMREYALKVAPGCQKPTWLSNGCSPSQMK